MEERERILKLLEESKINADEAAKLLNALGETYRWAPRHVPGPDFGKRIARKVELSLKGLPDMIERCVPFMDTGEEKELQFDPKERFTVKAVSGSVKIEGDEGEKIRIKLQGGHKVTEDKNELIVKIMTGDIDIAVPKSQKVELKGASSDLEIKNLTTELRVRCGAGDVDMENISGLLIATLGAGDLAGKEIAGEAHVAIGAGDVELDFAECKGGKVEVGSGDISVTLPEKANIELTIHKPKRGSIVSDFDFETPEDTEEFKVDIGKPKAKLYVKIKRGDITIHKRRKQ